MAADIERMRQQLIDVYPSEAWTKKVKGMSEKQVIAIHLRLRRSGKIKI